MSQASYYIESDNECVIIDPLRDIKIYEDIITKRGKDLKYVLETHFHADFISGHIDLSKKFNSQIIFGPNSNPSYDALIVNENHILNVGKIKIKIIHTPGHTLESVCYLLIDEKKNKHSLFTGDTLFIGDVGRPDLAVNSSDSLHSMTSLLYDSLYNKILKLPDHVIIYPGHGKGTQCGKNLSSKNKSTIGEQKLYNYALKFNNKDDFINSIIEDIPDTPDYFKESVIKNSKGYDNINFILKRSLIQLDINNFKSELINDSIVIDTRNSLDFSNDHVKNSINIGLNGRYAISAANLIDIKSKILIISYQGFEKESIMRLFRVGFENIVGYLKGGLDAWKKSNNSLERIKQISSNEIFDFNNYKVIDVRTINEYNSGHVINSYNYPLFDIENKIKDLDKKSKYIFYCQTGYRSIIAISLLKKHGFNNTIDVSDGFEGVVKNKSVEIIN